jgi:putative DNA primase/helicase
MRRHRSGQGEQGHIQIRAPAALHLFDESRRMMSENIIPLNAWKGKLASSKQGYKKSMTNLMLFLKNIPELGNTIRWNELAQRVEWNGRPLDDSDLIDIRLLLEGEQFDPSVADLLPAVMRHAKENGYHPVRDYLRSLKWDGTARLNHWMHLTLGAADTPFVRAVSRKTLIAAVARAFKPGCKVDTVLVLEGPQGIRKSTAIAALFGENLTAESVNLFDQHNKMVMSMMGAWCVELAEFIAIARRDQNTVKGMLSMRSDRVVLPYAKMASDHPRQCIFFGTINPGESGYLTDATGNRRYWPVPVTKADVELLADRRDQLWAEAYHAYLKNEQWWLTEEEEALAATQVAQRQEYDVWADILADKLHGLRSVTPAAAMEALGIPHERKDRKVELRIAAALKSIGFILRFPKGDDRKTYRRWERVDQ